MRSAPAAWALTGLSAPGAARALLVGLLAAPAGSPGQACVLVPEAESWS